MGKLAVSVEHVLLAVCLLSLYGSFASNSGVIIHIQQGSIRGTTFMSNRSNRTYFAFMGIPYAKPPVGNLRFKSPQPTESWPGIRNATKEGPVCPQMLMFNNYTAIGEEDCLVLNVYTPKLPSETSNKTKAVMVWIHGGGFVYGSGSRSIYGPDYFMDEDVVLVSFNYRLGVLGFLSLQNSEVPGNNGMKDQVLALKWVKQNIQSFGGDINNITIFGESAGAASVHYHLLSPMSRGLFHRAISQSGSALNPWAYQKPQICLNLAYKLAKIFGEETKDPHKILQILKRIPPDLLVFMGREEMLFPEIGGVVSPTLDTKADNGSVFLPDTPINLINSGAILRIPYITGVNSEEGILLGRLLKISALLLKPVVKIFEYALPLYIGQRIPKVNEMAAEVKDKYFNNARPLVLQYIDVVTDIFFINGVYCTAQKQANLPNSSIYAYDFSFSGMANIMKKICDGEKFPGACHGDDIGYFFQSMTFNISIPAGPSAEYNTSSRLLKMWTNFAKTGNPTPEVDPLLQNVIWKPVRRSHFPYLSIDTNLKLKHNLNNGHLTWWKKLYRKYVPEASPCWPSY